LQPVGAGQEIAQREITSALENAMDARRQCLTITQLQVSTIKSGCLYLQAICSLIEIAFVRSDNRLAYVLTMMLFATGVAAGVLLVAATDRPFIGKISVSPNLLLQVLPAPGS
jgi:hypothetical protein